MTDSRPFHPGSGVPAQLRAVMDSWQVVLSGGLAVLLAAVLTLALTGRDPATADTFVTEATGALIALPSGEERPARLGDRVPFGSTLRTGKPGGARLSTAGRDVYVGALSTVKVLDGVHQQLQAGQVMIDAFKGPRLTVDTAAGIVDAPSGTLARVENNLATLRLAVYRESAAITADGRRASTTVPALHQARVPFGGVPEPTTALALTVVNGVYDTWEQRLTSQLVQNDIDLNSFAAGLDGPDGLAVLRTVPASLATAGLAGRTTGEQALSVAVAQKAKLFRTVVENLAEVERNRGDGGSWGVVAAIVGAPVTDVTQVLGSSLEAIGPGTSGAPGSGDGSTPTGSTREGSGSNVNPRPTTTRTVSPTPTASRSSIDSAIDVVSSALPTPPPKVPVTPTPTPTATPDPLDQVVATVLGLLNP